MHSVAHILTWFVEECGPEIVENMPYLVDLQYRVLEIESVKKFIRSAKYYPLGDDAYCSQVQLVLGRES